MKKYVLVAVALLFSGSVFASQGGEGNNTHCNGKGNPNSPCVPTPNPNPGPDPQSVPPGWSVTGGVQTFTPTVSANGGAGGNATGVNVGGIGNKVLSPSASIEKGAVTNTNNNSYNPYSSNNGFNSQYQKQSVNNSGNSSSSSASSANGNGNNNGNIAAGAVSNTTSNSQSAVGSGNATTVSYNQDVAASTAFAPALTSGEDTCMGSSSVGGSGVGFGFSVGSTWTDTNCQRLKNARQMYNFGEKQVAIKMMCADAAVKKAAQDAGSNICGKVEAAPSTGKPESTAANKEATKVAGGWFD